MRCPARFARQRIGAGKRLRGSLIVNHEQQLIRILRLRSVIDAVRLGPIIVIAILVYDSNTVLVGQEHRVPGREKDPGRQLGTLQRLFEQDLSTPCAGHVAQPGSGGAGNIDEISGCPGHGTGSIQTIALIIRDEVRIVHITARGKDHGLTSSQRDHLTSRIDLQADDSSSFVHYQAHSTVAEQDGYVSLSQRSAELRHHLHAAAHRAVVFDGSKRTAGRNLVFRHMVQVIGCGAIECKHAPLRDLECAFLAKRIDRIRSVVIGRFEKSVFTLAQAQVRAVGLVAFGVGETRHVLDAVFFLVRDSLRLEREVVGNPQNTGRLG